MVFKCFLPVVVLVVIALMCVVGSFLATADAALAKDSERASLIFQTASKLLLAERYHEAIKEFQQFIAEYPNHILNDYAHFYLAVGLMKTASYEQARKIFKHLRTNYPQSLLLTEARFLEADTWFYQSKYDRAIQEYLVLKKGKKYKKHNLMPELLLKLGQCYEQQQQFGSALEIYHQIRLSYVNKPIYNKAKTYEEQVAAQHPSTQAFYTTTRIFKSIDIFVKSGKAGDALPLLTMLRTRPLTPALKEKAALKWAYSYYVLRENVRAKAHYRQFLRDYPKSKSLPYVLDRIGRIYLRQNNIDAFLHIYERLLHKHPQSQYTAAAMRLKGKELELQGKFQAALDEFNTFRKRFPKSSLTSDILWHIGWCHYQLRHYQSALKTFDLLVRSYPKSYHKEEALYWAGRSAEHSQQYTNAVKYYRRVMRNGHNTYFGALSQQALLGLKQVKSDLDIPQAEEKKPLEWEETAKFTTKQGRLHQEKSEAFIGMGFDNLAAQELAYAIEKDSKDHAKYLELARLYHRSGDYHQLVRLMQSQFWYWIVLGDEDVPQEFWQLVYPLSFPRLVNHYAPSNKIDPYLVQAVMLAESVFDPQAFSPAGAMGLMQLMPATGDRLAGMVNLAISSPLDYFRPEVNILLGTTYLKQLSQLFANHLPPVIASYNAGEDRVSAWWKEDYQYDDPVFIAMIPYKETWQYVQKVLWYYREYHRIYESYAAKTLKRSD